MIFLYNPWMPLSHLGGRLKNNSQFNSLALVFASIYEQFFPLPRHFGINTEATLEVAQIQLLPAVVESS